MHEVPQREIAKEGRWRKCCKMDCIRAPWLFVPDPSLSTQAGKIAAPVASGPPQALLQELGIVFKSCLNLTVWMILHVNVPIMIDQPSCNEVVIVSVELVLTKPPLLICEATCEGRVLDDFGSIRAGTSGEAWNASIDVTRCRTVEVSTFEVQSPKEVVDALREVGVLCTSESLTCHHTTETVILHGSQEIVESLAGPVDIVICEDSDKSGHFGDCSSHLASLVCLLDRHATNWELPLRASRCLVDCVVQLWEVFIDGHQDQLFGLILED